MEWTHLACLLAGVFFGTFLMTVWQNERRYRREREGEPIRISNVCWYPKATNPPPPAPPAPPLITEGRSRGNMKCQCGGRPMPDGPPPPLKCATH